MPSVLSRLTLDDLRNEATTLEAELQRTIERMETISKEIERLTAIDEAPPPSKELHQSQIESYGFVRATESTKGDNVVSAITPEPK